MGLNVVDHTSLELTTQLWSELTTKTCSTSNNCRRLQANKPNGWNSFKTSTTNSSTSLDMPTPLQTFSPTEKTLMRGWIPILTYSSPFPFSFDTPSTREKPTCKMTKKHDK